MAAAAGLFELRRRPVLRGTGPGAGSAIFVHADTGAPTAGCVALPRGDLDRLLHWLSPASSPLIVMGPDNEISRF